MNRKKLQEYVEQKLITERKHPDFDLYIYNYTPACTYGRHWDDTTLMCRGLILDGEGNIIARPFKKFFNLEEHEQDNIPELKISDKFEVYDKLDGSLGISYLQPDGQWAIATRGAFGSPQAIKGTELLKNYDTSKLNKDFTYLFEIIYPENRIVVNYGEEEKLVALSMIHSKSGMDFRAGELSKYGFNIVKRYDGIEDFKTLRNQFSSDNKEGFVIRFKGGDRVKLKFEEYIRLHRIVVGITPRRVWECLSRGEDMEDMLVGVPEEFSDKVHSEINSFKNRYKEIEQECLDNIKRIPSSYTRKEVAEYFYTCNYPNILFLFYDSKNYEKAIWKKLRPRGDKP